MSRHAYSTCVRTPVEPCHLRQNAPHPSFYPCRCRLYGLDTALSTLARSANRPSPKVQTPFNTHRCRVRRRRQRPRSNAPIESAPAAASPTKPASVRRGTSDWVIALIGSHLSQPTAGPRHLTLSFVRVARILAGAGFHRHPLHRTCLGHPPVVRFHLVGIHPRWARKRQISSWVCDSDSKFAHRDR